MPETNRRDMLRTLAVAGGVATALSSGVRPVEAATGPLDRSPLTQPPLPYAPEALAPVISARTVDFHYNKHHKGYFTNLARLVTDTPFASQSLEEVILATYGVPERRAIFNNAAQAWNHNLYWQSMAPRSGAPQGALAAAIDRDFGSRAALEAEWTKAAVGQFGSGWAWLVAGAGADRGKLKVVATSNADNPMTQGLIPLAVIDVWEHAYYLDDQNRRPDYVSGVIGLLDWDFVSTRYARV